MTLVYYEILDGLLGSVDDCCYRAAITYDLSLFIDCTLVTWQSGALKSIAIAGSMEIVYS